MFQEQFTKSQVIVERKKNVKRRKRINAEGDGLIRPLLKKDSFILKSGLSEKRKSDTSDAEILDILLPFKSVGERSSLTNLHDLLRHCPQPQPPITVGELKTLQLSECNAKLMREQIGLMKRKMEKLQDFVKMYCSTELLRDDIDFIITNIGSAIRKAEPKRNRTN